MPIRKCRLFGLILLMMLYMPSAQSVSGYRQAPEWDVAEWINGAGMSLADLKGQVVVVEFFQLWGPGSNIFSLPLMKYWNNLFAPEIEQGDLTLVSIHSVFERHDYQTPERLREFLQENDVTHPVGIESYSGPIGTPGRVHIPRQIICQLS